MAPVRTCIGCRRRQAPEAMVRIVARLDRVELGRGLAGRGAWLCPDLGCLDEAIRRRAVDRSLRASIDPQSLVELRSALERGAALPLRSEFVKR